MKKYTNYIIGLISIICISVFMNGYIKNKKEGFTDYPCKTVKVAITNYCNQSTYLVQNIQKILKGDLTYLKEGITKKMNKQDVSTMKIDPIVMLTLSGIDYILLFRNVMISYPNFFKDLFDNTDITDADFIIISNFYNLLRQHLIDLKITLVAIDNTNYTTTLPEEQKMEKPIIDDLFNAVNKEVRPILSTLEQVVLKIQNPVNSYPSNEGIDGLVHIYNVVKNIKECAKNDNYLFSDVTPNNKEYIFLYFRVIRLNIKLLHDVLDLYFVPYLEYKLANGQNKKVQKPEPIPENSKGPTVGTETPIGTPTTSFVGFGLIGGVGGATPS